MYVGYGEEPERDQQQVEPIYAAAFESTFDGSISLVESNVPAFYYPSGAIICPDCLRNKLIGARWNEVEALVMEIGRVDAFTPEGLHAAHETEINTKTHNRCDLYYGLHCLTAESALRYIAFAEGLDVNDVKPFALAPPTDSQYTSVFSSPVMPATAAQLATAASSSRSNSSRGSARTAAVAASIIKRAAEIPPEPIDVVDPASTSTGSVKGGANTALVGAVGGVPRSGTPIASSYTSSPH